MHLITCKNLFALGVPPPWCLALARVAEILGSDMPSTLRAWWNQHQDLLLAFSDSYAIEIFFSTNAMIVKSNTARLLMQLQQKENKTLTAKEFLLSLRFALEEDLRITAQFLGGTTGVPHNWSPGGLNLLSKSIVGDKGLDCAYQAEYLRLPLDDWLRSFACIVYTFNKMCPPSFRIKAITNDTPGYFHNWHKLTQVLSLLPHARVQLLDHGPYARWINQQVVMEPKSRNLGTYRSVLKKLLGTIFDRHHQVDRAPADSFLDRVFVQSTTTLIYETTTENVWQMEHTCTD